VIALSAVLLVAAGGYGWWSATYAPSVEVNGDGISKAEAAARATVDSFRISIEESRVRARVAAGTLTPTQGTSMLQTLSTSASSVSTQVTSEMIDALLVAKLAATRNISVTDAEAQAAWAKITSTPELRLVRRISVDIANDPKTNDITDATIAEAKAQADAIASKLASGTDFASLAKNVSTDSYAADGGLVGWSSFDQAPAGDEAYQALWELSIAGQVTAPIRHNTTQFVILKVDAITPAAADPSFEQRATESKVDLDLFKRMTTQAALQDKLEKAVVADLLVEPVEHRDVSYLSIDSTAVTDYAEEQLRLIYFSPNHDYKAAAKLDVKDPVWTTAQDAANAALKELQAGADFAAYATAHSDDPNVSKDGGATGWIAPGAPSVPGAIRTASFATGVQAGQLLGPIRTSHGYVLVKVEASRPSVRVRLDQLAASINEPGANFTMIAMQATKDFSGLQLNHPGWVSRYAINAEVSGFVWKVAAGKAGPVETSASKFSVIIYVNAAEQRPYSIEEKSAVRGNGFQVWLDEYRKAAAISIDGQSVQSAGESPKP
jgi:parvulin-like peptidyl-prolyl isomerase